MAIRKLSGITQVEKGFSMIRSLCAPIVILLLGQLISAPAQSQTTSEIYLSPTGSDSNSGTAQAPIKTLFRAHAIAAYRISSTPNLHLRINIKSGTYYDQTMKWTAVPPGGRLEFIGVGATKPVFDGRTSATATISTRAYLLSINPSFSGPTNIHISGLQIQNYLEGITFSAKTRDDINRGISDNSVEKSVFRRIGNIYARVLDPNTGAPKYGLAVVRLVNTKNSHFRGNDFIDIKNTNGSGQHAFYVAHYSSGNTFEGNRFANVVSGSTIKIRDFSNENSVVANDFAGIWPEAIQIWHCESADRPDCSKAPPGESRSYNTRESFNLFNGYVPVSVFYEAYGQNNPLPYNGVYGVIRDSVYRSGVMIRSADGAGTNYGICPATKASGCINSSRTCYASGTGSAHLWCANNNWSRCSITNLGLVSASHTCGQVSSSDANWTPTQDVGECIAQDTIRGGAQYFQVTKSYCQSLCQSFLKSAPANAFVYDCRFATGTTEVVLLKGRSALK